MLEDDDDFSVKGMQPVSYIIVWRDPIPNTNREIVQYWIDEQQGWSNEEEHATKFTKEEAESQYKVFVDEMPHYHGKPPIKVVPIPF